MYVDMVGMDKECEGVRSGDGRAVLRLAENAPPLNIEIECYAEHPHGRFMDLSFDCRQGVRMKGFWIEPYALPQWPAVLLVHPAPFDRSYFMDEAWELARSGIASLLIDAPWSEDAWRDALTLPDDALRKITIGFRKVQRGVELLSSIDDVDQERMGYLGMGLGALMGAIVVSMDRRLRAAVLMSGVGSFADMASLTLPRLDERGIESYRNIMSPIDPLNYIGNATPAQLLFQYGDRDDLPREKLAAFAEAGSEPKDVLEYDAGHYLNEKARREAVAWLVERLRDG